MVFDKKVDNNMAVFRFQDKEIGPVMVSKAINELIQKGDIVNLVIGRYEKVWNVLETGNVYPKGTM